MGRDLARSMRLPAMTTPDWVTKSRDYEKEHSLLAVPLEAATTHPLILNPPKVKVTNKSIKSSSSGKVVVMEAVGDPLSDPLSAAFADPLMSAAAPAPVVDDPLSMSAPTNTNKTESKIQALHTSQLAAKEAHGEMLNTPWQLKKLQIKNEYTISGNIVVKSSAMSEFVGSGLEDGSAARKVDKYDKRLANLEKRASTKDEKIEMSQKEYESHIQKLSDDLDRAWKGDDRVGTLKLAITLGKLLSDTSVPSFYPSMFVMVIDVLDRFKDMVYNRLLLKAEESLNGANPLSKKKTKLPADFTTADIPPIAKEICRNWFYKTSCIRDLLPRIYVEISLLKCYRFLTDTDIPVIVSRIGSMIRGLGDPLVALYARMYLVVVGNEVAPHCNGHALQLLQDTLFGFSMVRDPSFAAMLDKQQLTPRAYFYLLSPALEWIVKCVGRSADKDAFQGILQLYRDLSNDSMVLRHIIDSFDASHYCHASLGMVALIKAADVSCDSVVDLFGALGRQLAVYPPPEDQRLPLLNDVWKVIVKSPELLPFIKSCAAWLDVVQKHYSEREMMVLLSALASRVNQPGQELPDAAQPLLEALLTSLIGQSSTFGTAVLTSEHLLKIVDVFKGAKKIQLCKDILESFKSQSKTNDPVLINTIFDLARIVHDSIDGLSAATDVSSNAALLITFIDQIDFGRDLEQQLTFYVDCRSAFSNLDAIKDRLIVNVTHLAMKAFRFVKGKHTKKTSNFVKACLAYCYITIPSLVDVYRKLELSAQCAHVALANQHLPQTDAFLKSAISLLPEAPTHYEVDGKKVHMEERLADYLNNLLGFLVVAPGHPEMGPFYIVQGLLNALPKFAWNPNTPHQAKVMINMFVLLATYAQKQFPYHLTGVQSNDELYGGAPGYMSELQDLMSSCVAEILKLLTALGERVEVSSKIHQARSALDLVNFMAGNMELQQSVVEFLYKLVELATRSKASFGRAEQQYLKATVEAVTSELDKSMTDISQLAIPKFKALLTK